MLSIGSTKMNLKYISTQLANFIIIFIVGLSCSSYEPSTVHNIFTSINGNPVLPQTANKLYIAPFVNATSIPYYEEKIMQRVKEKIILNGRLAVVSDRNIGDITLLGTVLLYQIQPIEIDSKGIIKRKRLYLVTEISLIDEHSKNFIFKNIKVQAFKEFSDVEMPIVPLTIVQEEVEHTLAERIALQIETGWYTKLKSSIEKGKR